MTQQNKPPLPAPVQHPSTSDGYVRELHAMVKSQGTLGLRTHQEVLALRSELSEVKGDVAELRGHVIAAKSAVRGTSQNDMAQDAAIAALSAKIDANTGITEEVKKSLGSAFKHPAFVGLLVAVAMTLTALLEKCHP